MEKRHRKLLLQHRLKLESDLEANDVIGYLYQERLISSNDKERIEGRDTRRDRARVLLDLLPRKGPKAFHKFAEILRKVEGYAHLSDLLHENDSMDSCDGEPPQIVVLPKSSSKLLPEMLDTYPFLTDKHGWCFIVNNYHFDDSTSLSDRPGSDVDALALKSLFEKLFFQTWSVNNATAQVIKRRFTELANKSDHANCLVVCILTHGLAGKIYGVDGQLISISAILDILSQGNEKLQSIPKLFLIQACREPPKDKKSPKTNRPRSFVATSEVLQTSPNLRPKSIIGNSEAATTDSASLEFEPFVNEHEKPLQSDMLLGYSTFPGEVSWRHSGRGSYFISSVVEVFSDYALSEDVASMMIKVNQVVKEKVLVQGESQVPAPVVTLNKKLYLSNS